MTRTLYVLREPDGLRLLEPNQAFTSPRKRVTSDGEAAGEGAAVGSVVAYEVNHVPGWTGSYRADDLAKFLISTVEVDDTEPEGQQLVGFDVSEVDGAIVAQPVFAPRPAPPRRPLRKSVIQARVDELGKLGAAYAVLTAQPVLFMRWTVPDRPAVYADDEGLLSVLGAIGCTEAEIAAITAPETAG